MKVIDLLNKIASNELKDGTMFKYNCDYFKYWQRSKQFDRYTNNTYRKVEYYDDDLFSIKDLNKEIEIIENKPTSANIGLQGTPNSIRKSIGLPLVEEERLIQIPLEEYKELLVIKGRYEELIKKEIVLPKITYVNGIPMQEYGKEYDTYKITCNMESNGE